MGEFRNAEAGPGMGADFFAEHVDEQIGRSVGHSGQIGESGYALHVADPPEELADVEAVEKAGVTVFAQMVPNDEKKTFRSYLH